MIAITRRSGVALPIRNVRAILVIKKHYSAATVLIALCGLAEDHFQYSGFST